jgi:predicted TIM-barrel enzyme
LEEIGSLSTWSINATVFTQAPGLAGFFGASSFERLPMVVAISATARRFREIKLRNPRQWEEGAQ